MSLVSLQNVEVSFGAEDILNGVTGEIEKGDRIGLVGRNGAGKTTLLRVLAGELKPNPGQRHIARGTSVGIVEQIASQETSMRTVYAEGLSAVSDLLELEIAVEEAAHAMSNGGGDAEAHRYAELQHELEHRGGYTFRNRLSQVLNGLGLPEEQWQTPVRELSGGQRTRLALAKALLGQADLLILDEPTNHIDVDAMRWLDSFLANWPGTLVVTSHDRYFLDRVVNRVWSLEGGRVKAYRGNYSQFERQRQADQELLQKQAAAQQEFIAKEEAFIRRYGAGQRAREAQGRQKRLDRVERIVVAREQRSTNFKLKAQRSGNVVLTTNDLEVGYTGPLLRVGSVEVERGQRIALIGANGSGKTTLLKTISRELDTIHGSLRLGANVSVAHYWQEAENLDSTATVYEEMRRDRVMDPQEVRNILGRFLFSGSDVDKQVSALSGGERSRLALAKLMLEQANLLLLDEPTNHLDIPARESLEDALSHYPGSILFVSHDRRLIADLATSLWTIENGRLVEFAGSFEEYQEQSSAKDAPASKQQVVAPKAVAAAAPAPKLTYKMQARLTAVEHDIAAKEGAMTHLVEQIHEASARGDAKALAELGQQHDDLKATIDALMDEWATLTE